MPRTMRIRMRTMQEKLANALSYAHSLPVKNTRKNAARRARPTNITLDPAVKRAAESHVEATRFNSLSEWVTHLLRCELELNAPVLLERCAAEVEAAAMQALVEGAQRQGRPVSAKVSRAKRAAKVQ